MAPLFWGRGVQGLLRVDTAWGLFPCGKEIKGEQEGRGTKARAYRTGYRLWGYCGWSFKRGHYKVSGITHYY
ncbi:hypothetical protein CULTSU28_16260 [Corynebacterium ulcerans]|nr:hypothetical protein CULTSU28_16260 [Corynebacterium ulcerans]